MHPKKIDHSKLANELLKENGLLLYKINEATGISKQSVPELFVEVIRFLNLVAWSNQKLSPSLLVDYAWHEFILFTFSYQKFCHSTFGKFIHHHPGGTQKENQRQAKATLKLYSLYFGAPNIEYWGKCSDFFAPANCGPCETLLE